MPTSLLMLEAACLTLLVWMEGGDEQGAESVSGDVQETIVWDAEASRVVNRRWSIRELLLAESANSFSKYLLFAGNLQVGNHMSLEHHLIERPRLFKIRRF